MGLKESIGEIIRDFFRAYERGDLVGMYACLTTDFQRRVPLNYFRINDRYKQDIGFLESIGHISISADYRSACADVEIISNNKKSIIGIALEKDFGQWRILPDSVFNQ
ncbi:hypothetical protein [Lutispora sp.]|uniref:hypothetical protein n=1 Tax=Lutispora sp. TaxID=2828727 RepID=UPI0035699B9E